MSGSNNSTDVINKAKKYKKFLDNFSVWLTWVRPSFSDPNETKQNEAK